MYPSAAQIDIHNRQSDRSSSRSINEARVSLESPCPPTPTTPLPLGTSNGRQVYSLQRNIEEPLGQCRTLAFLMNDISTHETA